MQTDEDWILGKRKCHWLRGLILTLAISSTKGFCLLGGDDDCCVAYKKHIVCTFQENYQTSALN